MPLRRTAICRCRHSGVSPKACPRRLPPVVCPRRLPRRLSPRRLSGVPPKAFECCVPEGSVSPKALEGCSAVSPKARRLQCCVPEGSCPRRLSSLPWLRKDTCWSRKPTSPPRLPTGSRNRILKRHKKRHPKPQKQHSTAPQMAHLKTKNPRNHWENVVSTVVSGAFGMEDRGLEPLTSCMPCKRSPN